MHVCSAPVENRRGPWLAATVCYVEGRDFSKWRRLAQGQTWPRLGVEKPANLTTDFTDGTDKEKFVCIRAIRGLICEFDG
jgi:hypothetical protein